MIDETLEELDSSIAKAHESLRRQLSKIRTGRANADLLDSVRVDYYGTPTPLKQLATIGVPEARLLTLKPFDKTTLRSIEKAIMESELGLNPNNDGEIIRLPIPSLTEERRRELVKIAKRHQEEAKVSIRKARHDAKSMLETLVKEGDASEDDVDRALKRVEDIVQSGTLKVDEITSKKERDIIEL